MHNHTKSCKIIHLFGKIYIIMQNNPYFWFCMILHQKMGDFAWFCVTYEVILHDFVWFCILVRAWCKRSSLRSQFWMRQFRIENTLFEIQRQIFRLRRIEMFNGCEIVEQNSVSGQGFFALLRITVLDKNESYQTFCGFRIWLALF